METLLDDCKFIFDHSTLPFGIAEVTVDENNQPVDCIYRYINKPMEAYWTTPTENLIGKGFYEIWPNSDFTWRDHFYQAAFQGIASEFDSVSVALEQFFHAMVFPLQPPYCAFSIQDVTSWVSQSHLSFENIEAGLIFYDSITDIMLLTSSARDLCHLDERYLSLQDFNKLFFGDQVLEIENFNDSEQSNTLQYSSGKKSILYERKARDGRWFRVSLAHIGQTQRFTFGLLENVTRTKKAEEENKRRLDIIESLSRENFALYLVDLDADHIIPYRVDSTKVDNENPHMGIDGTRYSTFIESYCATCVEPADRTRFLHESSRDVLNQRIKDGAGDYSITFRRMVQEGEDFREMRILRIPHDNTNVLIAVRNTTNEILEQMRQKAILQTALEVAEHASEAKSTFLTNMSHDFRTPVNSITGFANIALDNINDIDRVKDCLHKIIFSSNHLLNLVNDILDVSRIESGKITLNEEPFSLEELKQSIVLLFEEQSRKKTITFTVDTERLVHTNVHADKLRIEQILVNIIGNALKFTSAGGTVQVIMRERSFAPKGYTSFVCEVIDTGCGMNPDFLDKIFEPFERDEQAYPQRIEGTGLGMTITKSLVHLMGGTIEVESELGKGSHFTVSLPLELTNEDRLIKAHEHNVHAYSKKRSFNGYHALVVDDDTLSREILNEYLRNQGFTFDEASDGDEAVRTVAQSTPYTYDIIIMDMRMPHMDGDEAARAIRDLDRSDSSEIPIIAVTADAFEEGRRRAKRAGFTAHTTKPLNLDKLTQLLDHYLPETPLRQNKDLDHRSTLRS